jgi:lipopolysaccharide heptosyltransferase I
MVVEPATPARVLIIKPSSLGDVVTALPVLRGLKRTAPDSHVAWLLSTSCQDLLAEDADLDEIVPFERKRLGRAWRSPAAAAALRRFRKQLRAGGYDWTIDLQGLLRSGWFTRWTRAPVRAGFADAREGSTLFYTHRVPIQAQHTVERNIQLARALGIDCSGDDMTLAVPTAGRAFAERIADEHGLTRKGFVACVPPTRWDTKRYPVRHWRAVIEQLVKDLPVAVLGPPAEVDLCRGVADGIGGVLNLAGQTSLGELVGVLAAAAGVVCSDSAAKFLAPAVGTDVVTLLGPTRVERTGPYRLGTALLAPVACQGCLRKRCDHLACMESIAPDRVVAAAKEMLKRDS